MSKLEQVQISDDKSLLQIETVCRFMKQTSWAAKRSQATIEKSIAASVCFGAYLGDRQIGFARVVTDGCTFGYLCDVFVDEEHRGYGVSKKLMAEVMKHPELQNLRRFTLATREAHGLYEKFGFEKSLDGTFMQIKNENV